MGFRSGLCLVLAAWSASPAHTADKNQPHDHTGELEKYTRESPTVKLSGADLDKLANGQPVHKVIAQGSGGRATAVQDVAAPPDQVWYQITDYETYPKKVQGCLKCDNYYVKKEGGKEIVKSRYVIGALGKKFEYFIEHTAERSKNCMTFHLDYDRRSDFADSVGYWYVMKHPVEPQWTRVYYSTDLKMRGWVPGPVKDFLTKKALTKSTAWVNTESVAAYEASRTKTEGGWGKQFLGKCSAQATKLDSQLRQSRAELGQKLQGLSSHLPSVKSAPRPFTKPLSTP